MDTVWEDDIKDNACNYVAQADAARWGDDASYGEDNLNIKKNLTEAMGNNFNIPTEQLDDWKFSQFALLGDKVFAEMFENIPQTVDWEQY